MLQSAMAVLKPLISAIRSFLKKSPAFEASVLNFGGSVNITIVISDLASANALAQSLPTGRGTVGARESHHGTPDESEVHGRNSSKSSSGHDS